MQRITITIDDDLLASVDHLVKQHGYDSRSEAVREMVRSFARARPPEGDSSCIATLSCIYDHATRGLAKRMNDTLHDHHSLTVASLHVHLDHDTCLDVSVMRGPCAAVQHLADAMTGQRGVRHANLHVVPIQVSIDRHDHGAGEIQHEHIHA